MKFQVEAPSTIELRVGDRIRTEEHTFTMTGYVVQGFVPNGPRKGNGEEILVQDESKLDTRDTSGDTVSTWLVILPSEITHINGVRVVGRG